MQECNGVKSVHRSTQANTERHTRTETREMCSCWGYKQHLPPSPSLTPQSSYSLRSPSPSLRASHFHHQFHINLHLSPWVHQKTSWFLRQGLCSNVAHREVTKLASTSRIATSLHQLSGLPLPILVILLHISLFLALTHRCKASDYTPPAKNESPNSPRQTYL